MKLAVYFLLILVLCLSTTAVAQKLSIQDLTKIVLQLLVTQKLQKISRATPVSSPNQTTPVPVVPSGSAADQAASFSVASSRSMVNQVSKFPEASPAIHKLSSVPRASSSSATTGSPLSSTDSNQRSTTVSGSPPEQKSTLPHHSSVNPKPAKITSNPRTSQTPNAPQSPSVIAPEKTTPIRLSKHVFTVLATSEGLGIPQASTKRRGPTGRISAQASLRPSASSVNHMHASGKTGLSTKPVYTKIYLLPESPTSSTVHVVTPSHIVNGSPPFSSNTVHPSKSIRTATSTSNAPGSAHKTSLYSHITSVHGSSKPATTSNLITQATPSNSSRLPGKPTSYNTILSPTKPYPSGTTTTHSSSVSLTSSRTTKTIATNLKSSPSPSVSKSIAAASTRQAIETTKHAVTPETTTAIVVTTDGPLTKKSSPPNSTVLPADPSNANLTLSFQRFTELGNQLTTLLQQQSSMYNTQAAALGMKASNFKAKARTMPLGSPKRNELEKKAQELRSQQVTNRVTASKSKAATLLTELKIEISDVFIDVSATNKELTALHSQSATNGQKV